MNLLLNDIIKLQATKPTQNLVIKTKVILLLKSQQCCFDVDCFFNMANGGCFVFRFQFFMKWSKNLCLFAIQFNHRLLFRWIALLLAF